MWYCLSPPNDNAIWREYMRRAPLSSPYRRKPDYSLGYHRWRAPARWNRVDALAPLCSKSFLCRVTPSSCSPMRTLTLRRRSPGNGRLLQPPDRSESWSPPTMQWSLVTWYGGTTAKSLSILMSILDVIDVSSKQRILPHWLTCDSAFMASTLSK